LYWTNFNLPIQVGRNPPSMNCNQNRTSSIEKEFIEFHEITDLLNQYKGKQDKRKIARNLVDYEAGKTIFQEAANIILNKKAEQIGLFSSRLAWT
jgi:DNA (cytosine-5)-methyltransferase 1